MVFLGVAAQRVVAGERIDAAAQVERLPPDDPLDGDLDAELVALEARLSEESSSNELGTIATVLVVALLAIVGGWWFARGVASSVSDAVGQVAGPMRAGVPAS